MAHVPNEQQAKAIGQFDFDLLVSAGAGTGKTSVLTEKYLYLMKEFQVDVSKIVAITFTNKAAAEMLLRIRQRIEAQLMEATVSEEVEYWKRQLQRMDYARISTFHSFCLGLIKEHPLEAGILPGATIMNDGESLLYLNQVINDVFTGLSRESKGDSGLESLLVEFGWNGLLESCRDLYQTIRESGQAFGEVFKLTAENLGQSRGGIQPDRTELIGMVETLFEYYPTQKLTPRAKEILGSLKLSWPKILPVLEGPDDYNLIMPAFFQISKALPLNLPNCVKESVAEIRSWLDTATQRYTDQAALGRLPLLEEIFTRIDCEYQKLKLELGLLDFTDQQLAARNMLRDHPDLAEKLRQGIRYLLVDEFQDTNSLQLELIRELIGQGYTGGRWMAVGDVKQSIYRFRGAEAGLIVELAQEFAGGNGAIVPLSENYRSSLMVIDYVNRLSERIFEGENFSYEPLCATQGDQGSRIEFLMAGSTDLQAEARMVAARIRQWVDSSQGSERPVDYKDIVILFRAGSGMGEYQAAFQEAGIPYYMASGSNFYNRPEIVDQLNLLRLIDQAYDSVALYALLISPYAGISEANLLRLGRGRELAEGFYEAVNFEMWTDTAQQERFERFRETILYLQKHRESMKISEIIRYALNHLNYQAYCRVFTDASQRLANLEKLILKADEFSAQGFHSTTGFLMYVTRLIEAEMMETDAPTHGESNNVVRLMTIHRSKGLEFPIVVLADLDRRFRFGKNQKLAFHKNIGIGFKLRTTLDESVATSVWERIKALEKAEEISELKRLLYVALTRAKEHLILAGSGNNPAKGDSLETTNNWMKWFEIIHPFTEAEELNFDGIPLQLTRQVLGVREVAQEVRLIETTDLQSPVEDSCHEVAASISTAGLKPFTLKATGILVYRDCPRRFLYRYLYGVSEANRLERSWESATDGMGAEIGNFLHQAARLRAGVWPEALWDRFRKKHHLLDPTRIESDLRQMWENLVHSQYAVFQKVWDEVPFVIKVTPEVRVEGRFDRLLVNQEGELILVDYKTHRIAEFQTTEVAQHYFWQVQLYALAVKELWGKLPDRAELYFPYPNRWVRVPLDADAIQAVMNEIQTMAEWIATYREPEHYPTKSNCPGCGYQGLCGGVS